MQLLFLSICLCASMPFPQQCVSVTIRYLLIITCDVSTAAASPHHCSTVPLLKKAKSVSDRLALDGLRQ